MKKIIACLVVTTLLFSCKKESDTQSCWQIIDIAGNDLQVECDKTESEIKAFCGGECSFENFTTNRNCRYYYRKQ